jgi:hypothetical protein
MKVSVWSDSADDRHLRADRHVDALRLAVPDIDAAISELGEGFAFHARHRRCRWPGTMQVS